MPGLRCSGNSYGKQYCDEELAQGGPRVCAHAGLRRERRNAPASSRKLLWRLGHGCACHCALSFRVEAIVTLRGMPGRVATPSIMLLCVLQLCSGCGPLGT